MNHFAGSFLMSGIKSFIGSNWKIIDNNNTIEFIILFYTYLFSDKTIGEALFLAKEYGRRNFSPNDLTWANYSLHGYPDYQIVTDSEKEDRNLQKIINPSSIFSFYPTCIARSYHSFLNLQNDSTPEKLFKSLILTFEELSKIIGSIIFSDHLANSMGRDIPNNPDDSIEIGEWWELIYNCLDDFSKLEISPLMKLF